MTVADGRLRNPRADMGLRPSSMRRSVRLDMSWPGSEAGDPMARQQVHALSDDTLVDAAGVATLVASARMDVVLSPGHVVDEIVTEPPLAGAEILLGRRASSGWRAMVRGLVAENGPLLQLLDDLPVGVLISGYAGLRTGALNRLFDDKRFTSDRMTDICIGWAQDSIALRTLHSADHAIVPEMVAAPTWEQPEGPEGALQLGVIRRERRIDVWHEGGGLEVEATFRDSFGDAHVEGLGAGEGVLHEYALRARVENGLLVSLVPEPRVLPYPECPGAVRATSKLIGEPVAELGTLVPEVLVNISSCTHLNDLLRSLSGVEALALALG